MKENENFSKLAASYLFPEIAKRRREYVQKHPEVKVISLGIGKTTEPLPSCIADAMAKYAKNLATAEGYSGYGEDCGNEMLRKRVAEVFYSDKVLKRAVGLDYQDVFISDGAKCDIARLQVMFGGGVKVFVQDPAYPVYVDGSIIMGCQNIEYLPCTCDNDFFPNLNSVTKGSVIYFCSPNNPTGSVATKEQLQKLVATAKDKECIIVFDAAYNQFIRDESLPKSIYEIEGSETCAIEVNSFSKPAGFTGVRLGWSVVPKGVKWSDGALVSDAWTRVQTTLFNCASNIAQEGGLAALTDEGLLAMRNVIDYYLENARLIEKALKGENFASVIERVHYTENSPYLWVRFKNMTSWQAFDTILDKCHIVTTPGSGFGQAGERYLRFSAFSHRDDVIKACERLAAFAL